MIMENNPGINENKGCLDPSYLPLVRLYKERQETKKVSRCGDGDNTTNAVKESVKLTQQEDQKGDARTTQQYDTTTVAVKEGVKMTQQEDQK